METCCENCKHFNSGNCTLYPEWLKVHKEHYCSKYEKNPTPLIKLSPQRPKKPKPKPHATTDEELRQRAMRDTGRIR